MIGMFLTSIQKCPEYQWYGALLIVEWLILHVRKCFPHRWRHIGGINSINKPQLTGDTGSNRNSFLCIFSWLWTSNITPCDKETTSTLSFNHWWLLTNISRILELIYTTHTLHLTLQFALRIFTQLYRIVGTNY